MKNQKNENKKNAAGARTELFSLTVTDRQRLRKNWDILTVYSYQK